MVSGLLWLEFPFAYLGSFLGLFTKKDLCFAFLLWKNDGGIGAGFAIHKGMPESLPLAAFRIPQH